MVQPLSSFGDTDPFSFLFTTLSSAQSCVLSSAVRMTDPSEFTLMLTDGGESIVFTLCCMQKAAHWLGRGWVTVMREECLVREMRNICQGRGRKRERDPGRVVICSDHLLPSWRPVPHDRHHGRYSARTDVISVFCPTPKPTTPLLLLKMGFLSILGFGFLVGFTCSARRQVCEKLSVCSPVYLVLPILTSPFPLLYLPLLRYTSKGLTAAGHKYTNTGFTT